MDGWRRNRCETDHEHFPWQRTELRTQVHRLRAGFTLHDLPRTATLYLAGPRWAKVYLNGTLLGEFSTNVDQRATSAPFMWRLLTQCAGAKTCWR